jgi:hypothetical protein
VWKRQQRFVGDGTMGRKLWLVCVPASQLPNVRANLQVSGSKVSNTFSPAAAGMKQCIRVSVPVLLIESCRGGMW